jgi:hypothetical protein
MIGGAHFTSTTIYFRPRQSKIQTIEAAIAQRAAGGAVAGGVEVEVVVVVGVVLAVFDAGKASSADRLLITRRRSSASTMPFCDTSAGNGATLMRPNIACAQCGSQKYGTVPTSSEVSTYEEVGSTMETTPLKR